MQHANTVHELYEILAALDLFSFRPSWPTHPSSSIFFLILMTFLTILTSIFA